MDDRHRLNRIESNRIIPMKKELFFFSPQRPHLYRAGRLTLFFIDDDFFLLPVVVAAIFVLAREDGCMMTIVGEGVFPGDSSSSSEDDDDDDDDDDDGFQGRTGRNADDSSCMTSLKKGSSVQTRRRARGCWPIKAANAFAASTSSSEEMLSRRGRDA